MCHSTDTGKKESYPLSAALDAETELYMRVFRSNETVFPDEEGLSTKLRQRERMSVAGV